MPSMPLAKRRNSAEPFLLEVEYIKTDEGISWIFIQFT